MRGNNESRSRRQGYVCERMHLGVGINAFDKDKTPIAHAWALGLGHAGMGRTMLARLTMHTWDAWQKHYGPTGQKGA